LCGLQAGFVADYKQERKDMLRYVVAERSLVLTFWEVVLIRAVLRDRNSEEPAVCEIGIYFEGREAQVQ